MSAQAVHRTITCGIGTRVAVGLLLASVLAVVGADSDFALRARAERLHRNAVVIDGHNDIPSLMLDVGFDLGESGDNPDGLIYLGVRYMTLTHTGTHDWADSSGDLDDPGVQHHGGLTDFGREIVREMNRLGMIIDVSHASDETFRDVLKATRAPIIASHSSCRALAGHPRNLSDDMHPGENILRIMAEVEHVAAREATAAKNTPGTR